MTRAGTRSRSPFLLAAVSLVFLACGASSGGDGDGDGDVGDSCDEAVNCNGTAICDPTDNTCQEDVSCDGHDECGKGGSCNTATGLCEVAVTGSPCGDDDDCQRGEACVAADNTTGGFCGCDGEEFEPMPVTPNMLIVLDRSGSMRTNDVPGTDDGNGNELTRMQVAQEAVTELVSTFDANIRFGLSMYPGPDRGSDGCDPGEIDVGIGDNTGSMVADTVNNTDGDGSTPLVNTLDAAASYPGLMDPTRPNYVISLQDGAPNCETNADDESVNKTAALFDLGIRTFVIGFGDGLGSGAQDTLNEMAVAGGTARMMGGQDYYAAETQQELEDAFNTIGGQVLACSFQLNADEDAIVRVFFDGGEIPDGWTFDPENGTITFDDQMVCDELQGGNVDELVIVNSCPLGTD